MTKPEFIFTTCQAGAEAVLKQEVLREWPTFKFAYSRPGFLTFKIGPDVELTPDFDLRCAFARTYGLSFGKVQGTSMQERVFHATMLAREYLSGPVRLNVYEREKTDSAKLKGAEGIDPTQVSKFARAAEASLRSAFPDLFLSDGLAVENETVFSVVLVEEGEWWLGYHLHSRYHRPWTGGVAPFKLPAQAPSRAYLKLREGLSWPGLPIRSGETALELGSAPGGASFALLERGLTVIGVDPANMSPALLENAAFRHIRLQAKQVRLDEVGPVDWLFSDMNIAPGEALDAVEKLVKGMDKDRLLGALLTLKLNNWNKPQEVPELISNMLERLQKIGFADARATQLFYNRQEVCVACFTQLGLERVASNASKGVSHLLRPVKSPGSASKAQKNKK